MVTKYKPRKAAYRLLCPEVLAKIKEVRQITKRRENRAGTILKNTYWYGYYTEDGIAISTYIGKRLPPVLQKLLDGRVWNSDREVYHWPKSHHLKVAVKGGG